MPVNGSRVFRHAEVRQSMGLVHSATRRVNGANIHKATALLAAYENAVDFARDPRCPDQAKAVEAFFRVQDAVQTFAATGVL